MTISTQTKMALGAAFGTIGALGIVLSFLLEWSATPRPWSFLIGFILGLLSGLGVTLVLSGLIDLRRGS